VAPDYWISLPPKLAEYRDDCKLSKAERQAEHIDGSLMELQIATVLLRKGWSDEEILDYFDFHQLPRHMEDCKKDGSYTGTLSRIATARESVLSYSSRSVDADQSPGQLELVEGLPTNPPHVIESEHNLETQTYASGALRLLALRIVSEWDEKEEIHKLTDWRKRIIEESAQLPEKPVSMMTARRLTDGLIESGYVEAERIDGRSDAPHLTEKGCRASEPVRGKWRRMIPLKTRRPLGASVEQSVEEEVEEDEIPVVVAPPRKTAKAPAPQRRDPRYLHTEGYRKRSQINGHYRLRFAGNTIRYIQLLAPIEERVGGPLWLYLPTGYDDDGLALFSTVVADEDPDEDPLCSVMPEAWEAHEQYVLPAAELVKTSEGFQVAEHLDEAGERRPSIGVICQSRFNFFRPLQAIEPNGRIVQVKGSGSSAKPRKGAAKNYRRFQFTDVGQALPLAISFDFEQFLADLLDPGHLQRALTLPKGWFYMPEQRHRLIHRLTDGNY
jgi:hypothetical protein